MMFAKPKLRNDLPPIDLRFKEGRGLFGPKKVRRTRREQRAAKDEMMKQYPDRWFLDELDEWNSIDPDEELLEMLAVLDEEEGQ